MFLKSVLVLLVAASISLASPIQSNAILRASPRSLVLDCFKNNRPTIVDARESARKVLEGCSAKNIERILELYDNSIENYENVEPEFLTLMDELFECDSEVCADVAFTKIVALLYPAWTKMNENVFEMEDLFEQEDQSVRTCSEKSYNVLVEGLMIYVSSLMECLMDDDIFSIKH